MLSVWGANSAQRHDDQCDNIFVIIATSLNKRYWSEPNPQLSFKYILEFMLNLKVIMESAVGPEDSYQGDARYYG